MEIYSDVVCPWCYIGKRRFEAALARFEGAGEVEVVWRPFQLDPGAPVTPTPVREAYARKFGGPEAATAVIERVTTAAAGDGIELRLDIAQRANTFDAHRLLWWAEGHGHQDELEEALMRAYFTQGRDVGDRGELAAIAGEAGLDPAAAAAFLASDEGRADVRAQLDQAYEKGITAVPTFVFAGTWAVPGAQEPDTMLLVLERVAARAAAAGHGLVS